MLKQRHLELVVQDSVQLVSDYHLHKWRLHHHSGQPVPALGQPHSGKEFSDIQMEPPVFQFVPIASCLVTGSHRKEPD